MTFCGGQNRTPLSDSFNIDISLYESQADRDRKTRDLNAFTESLFRSSIQRRKVINTDETSSQYNTSFKDTLKC